MGHRGTAPRPPLATAALPSRTVGNDLVVRSEVRKADGRVIPESSADPVVAVDTVVRAPISDGFFTESQRCTGTVLDGGHRAIVPPPAKDTSSRPATPDVSTTVPIRHRVVDTSRVIPPAARSLHAVRRASQSGKFNMPRRVAIEELKSLEPKNHLHLRNEGLLYARMGKLDEAERVFREICRLEPARGFGYAALADLLLRRGRALAEARGLAERAVDLEPTAQHWTLLATTANQMGDRTAARAALERALALDPGNPQIKSVYASISQEK